MSSATSGYAFLCIIFMFCNPKRKPRVFKISLESHREALKSPQRSPQALRLCKQTHKHAFSHIVACNRLSVHTLSAFVCRTGIPIDWVPKVFAYYFTLHKELILARLNAVVAEAVAAVAAAGTWRYKVAIAGDWLPNWLPTMHCITTTTNTTTRLIIIKECDYLSI